MIRDKIKALLKMNNKSNDDGAKALNMPYYSFGNKLNQRGFKTEDLIKLANLTETKLAFIDENDKPVITFDMTDLEETTNK